MIAEAETDMKREEENEIHMFTFPSWWDMINKLIIQQWIKSCDKILSSSIISDHLKKKKKLQTASMYEFPILVL